MQEISAGQIVVSCSQRHVQFPKLLDVNNFYFSSWLDFLGPMQKRSVRLTNMECQNWVRLTDICVSALTYYSVCIFLFHLYVTLACYLAARREEMIFVLSSAAVHHRIGDTIAFTFSSFTSHLLRLILGMQLRVKANSKQCPIIITNRTNSMKPKLSSISAFL